MEIPLFLRIAVYANHANIRGKKIEFFSGMNYKHDSLSNRYIGNR